MRALVQRVATSAVKVDGETVGSIDRGLLVFVGVMGEDSQSDAEWLANKLTRLRIFPDDEGKMNLSVLDAGGSMLLVSQFTLCADVRKGTRPSFTDAMGPAPADSLFRDLVSRVGQDVPVQTGRFQAHMLVSLVNDGPVTIWLDSAQRSRK